MAQAGKLFFDSIKKYSDLERLVNEGESENMFLECKSPSMPSLNADLRKTLAKALSGFSNTNGGVIIWGASTTKKSHSGLDIITQIEPLGNCSKFQREIENRIPTLTIPSITNFEHKIIKKSPKDTRGVLLTYIPKMNGDPVQNVEDEFFYFRSGDDFVKTPYEMLKRLFLATDNPDLTLEFSKRLAKIENDRIWKIPLVIINNSSAIAEKIKVFFSIENSEDCEILELTNFKDNTDINPQFKKVFIQDVDDVVYKGLNLKIGDLIVKLKGKKTNLLLSGSIYANRMVTKEIKFKIALLRYGIRCDIIKEHTKY